MKCYDIVGVRVGVRWGAYYLSKKRLIKCRSKSKGKKTCFAKEKAGLGKVKSKVEGEG